MSKFVLQPEDGSVQNGNLRGDDSVDLQVARSVNTQVASGYASFIMGGLGNTASGNYTGAFGANNTSAGTGAITFGVGNQAIGNYSLSAGLNSQSLGQGSTSIGYESIAYGLNSSIAFSSNSLTDATAPFSTIVGGADANTYLYGQTTSAGGKFATAGDAQASSLMVRRAITSASAGDPAYELYPNGVNTTFVLVPKGNNRAWSCVLDTIAVCTAQGGSPQLTIGDIYSIKQSFFIKKVGGVLTVSSLDTIAEESDTHMSTSLVNVTVVGAVYIAITFSVPTTALTSNFRVVSKLDFTEVAW